MNFKTLFQKNSIAARLLIALVIYLITFPAFNLITSPGLDSSYTWGLNYLLVHDYETLKQLVYPIGVLGFLKMPLAIGNNLIWAIVFYSIIKFWFLFSLLSLSISEYKVKRIIQFVLVVIISMYSGFDITLVALCVLLGIRFLEHQKLLSILMLTIVAYISFNIKTSIGISAFSVLFMTVTINFLKLKDWKQLLKIIGISISTILIIGIILFQDFGLIVTRFFQAFKISSGYSSSLSLHPDNNWLVLSGFILSILLIPLIFKTKRIRILFYQFLPSFFMMWKHAMVREDASHNGILFYFTLIFWAMAIIYCNKNIWRMGILGIASMSLFYLNLKNIDGFNRINLNLNGIKNLNEIVHYKKCVEDNNQITSKELEKLKLNSETLNTIGQQTIDFYPWEHSYAKANKLNWHPRKTIELGASSSQWSSAISASHYQGNNSPEFVLFHYQSDRYEGNLGAFDGRYMLNDEPLLVENLIENYQIESKNKTFSLFKKRSEKISLTKKTNTSKLVKFNQWISIPEIECSFIQCKVNVQNSLTQKATTFLYKDDLYLVDYKLKDGRVLTYRFTPNTAVDGLWCNPFVSSFNSTDITTDVVQLRFRKLHYGGKQGKLKIQFVLNNIDSTNNYVRPFGISTKNKIKTILSIKQDFETQSEIWFEPENDGFESNQSNKIKTDQYSFTHRYSLDSIWSQIDSGINSIQIQAQTLYKIDGEKSDIIIEVKNSQNDFWKSTRLPKSHDWNYTYVPKTINREEHATGELLIYCWNKDKNPLLIDNFELRIVQKY